MINLIPLEKIKKSIKDFLKVSVVRTVTLSFFVGFYITLAGTTFRVPASATNVTTASVSREPVGATTQYIGACEGNVNFDISDINDLNINTYRIYGGMSRWETEDDDGIYGFPTISQIKKDPNLIPWEHWDEVMAIPESGTDYLFSGISEDLWKGSAQTIFKALRQHRIRPVLAIRNTDPGWNPSWALQLNPPRTEADWNEWWEHVFATVYWLNVRNDYQVNDFEVHNEPDNLEQGWGGDQADYFNLVKATADAIDYVYDTYLPDREYHIHAPVSLGYSDWPRDAIANIPLFFNSINIHSYSENISSYIRTIYSWMENSVHDDSPVWLTEWGSYTGGYNDLGFSLNLIKNLIRASQPGDSYIYGSHLFSLYDWGKVNGFEGLISADGHRRLSYYAFRLGIRALQGGKSVLLSSTNSRNIMTMATRDEDGQVYVLMVNDQHSSHEIELDLSHLRLSSEATLWEFSESVHDEVIGHPSVSDGHVTLALPSQAAVVLQLSPQS